MKWYSLFKIFYGIVSDGERGFTTSKPGGPVTTGLIVIKLFTTVFYECT